MIIVHNLYTFITNICLFERKTVPLRHENAEAVHTLVSADHLITDQSYE